MSIVAEVVAGAALSAFFDKLFDKFSSSDLLKTFRKENFDADLKKWESMLLKIQLVLDDAEEKQLTSRLVKIWLDELEDLAYDVDDILDEFATEALRRQLNPEPKSDFVKQMRSKIEGIDRRLQEIVEEKKDLELRENTGRRTITKTSRPPSTSLVNESRTYGRDEDKMKIVKLLLESSDAQLSVIPIVGMGGLGKTTLAQLVYKDDEVSRHFQLKAWVCVSEDFDNLRLTKEILHSTSESCHDNNNLDSLQGKLKNTLSGKKFLLILDDVWNENYELWTELCKPFEFGAQGSKIVVTTRNDDVSSIMGTTPPYKLKELSRDACLRVFTHHALDATDFSEYPELKKYGQEIVDRCKGAPLAAKALGGLLRSKHDPCEWEDVLNSKIWDIPEDKSSIFSVLRLSYNYLPSHLKRCFAYCSLFPKDYEFQERELVLLWMAEGLIQETKAKKPMEDLGGDYFRDLLNRSFFQQSSSYESLSFFQQSSSYESLFVMHDLMNDLAMWAAGDLCCRLEDQLGGSKQFEISTKVRHFLILNIQTIASISLMKMCI
ncbi:putative disease resistance RPP13-like protein 1 isoform X1 [Quercus lobata]|uniref:putative disease resistance RPP13-like protein 1 isoform X1 n=1 Tax=Quercus lobata TaxID=97700 RepID=UPI00124719A3|nr:putative disease resistance RPP13-like protein 1 isoform X1 [Quercus lobata]